MRTLTQSPSANEISLTAVTDTVNIQASPRGSVPQKMISIIVATLSGGELLHCQ
jgi:hypothetical protein